MIELYKTLTKSQMIAALRTLEQSIERCGEETWFEDHIDGPVNQVVFHTLFYADLYLNPTLEGFKEQEFHRDNQDCFLDYEEMENRKPENTYEIKWCREYLEFCVGKARMIIDGETEESLGGESGFSWRDSSRAEHHVYNTRHIQHHAAQLGLRHQLLGGAPLKWIGAGT